MSYICQITGKPMQGRPKRLVVATRERVYQRRYDQRLSETVCIDSGGRGTETEKELLISPDITDGLAKQAYAAGLAYCQQARPTQLFPARSEQ